MTAHLRLPLELAADGTFVTVAQGSDEELVQSVRILLGTRPGERVAVSGYGIPDPTFRTVHRPDEIVDAVRVWEPRATAEVVVRAASEGPWADVLEVGIAPPGQVS